MKVKDLVLYLSSYRTLIISDFDTQEELKVYPACDIRVGSPYEYSDISKSVERDRNISTDFGDYYVKLITCDHSCLYVDVYKGVSL